LAIALALGLFLAAMVFASQFNGFLDPLTVLAALPFSVSGADVALFVAYQTINIYSMIGLILLVGIVKKNSILLVDFDDIGCNNCGRGPGSLCVRGRCRKSRSRGGFNYWWSSTFDSSHSLYGAMRLQLLDPRRPARKLTPLFLTQS